MEERTKQLPMEIPEKKTQLDHRKGKIAVKYRKIAFLASKGLNSEDIGKEVNLSADRITKILQRDDVWEESKRLIRESFEGSEKMTIDLLNKALRVLDDLLLFGTPEEKRFAIDKTLRMFQAKDKGEGKTFINQFFSGVKEDSGDWGKRLDEIVIQKRRERGLPDYPDDNDL